MPIRSGPPSSATCAPRTIRVAAAGGGEAGVLIPTAHPSLPRSTSAGMHRGSAWDVAGQAGAVFEKALQHRGGERAGEQEPLGEVATLALELADLAVILDSLGQRLQAEGLAELDQGVGERVHLAG